MIKEIIKDKEILSKQCDVATADDAPIAQDLVDTLLAQEDAVCLAANQIGETKAIVVYLNGANKPIVLFNPKIIQNLNSFTTVEDCLSHDQPLPAVRYKYIRITYDELVDGELVPRKKKFNDWTAQVIQHTIDHCNGVLV